MHRLRILITLAAIAATASAQTAVERAFANARKNPTQLRAFLYGMPKGGDLHVHVSGALYAENMIAAAAKGAVCIDKKNMSFVAPKAVANSFPPKPVCGDAMVPASDALKEQALYDALVNSFSMRSYVPTTGFSGHDQFFSTFSKFSEGVKAAPTGHWIDEIATRAADQNEQYLELMHTPNLGNAIALAQKVKWDGQDIAAAKASLDQEQLARLTKADSDEINAAEAGREQVEECHTDHPKPACKVQVRYLFQVLRALPAPLVVTQTILAFEVANSNPNVVGLNFVQPEDAYLSMSQYDWQMKMVGALHAMYPKVHITLHAGELAYGMVPPDGLRFHIREAVEVAHAERIGHGVDVMYEDNPEELLKELAAKKVMVEINLTSNDVILGVKGAAHPLHDYMRHKVPFALSTDDEGVSRIDLTNEYMRAVTDQDLTYAQLKTSARNSLQYSFLSDADKAAALKEYDSRVKTFEAGFATKGSSK